MLKHMLDHRVVLALLVSLKVGVICLFNINVLTVSFSPVQVGHNQFVNTKFTKPITGLNFRWQANFFLGPGVKLQF